MIISVSLLVILSILWFVSLMLISYLGYRVGIRSKAHITIMYNKILESLLSLAGNGKFKELTLFLIDLCGDEGENGNEE